MQVLVPATLLNHPSLASNDCSTMCMFLLCKNEVDGMRDTASHNLELVSLTLVLLKCLRVKKLESCGNDGSMFLNRLRSDDIESRCRRDDSLIEDDMEEKDDDPNENDLLRLLLLLLFASILLVDWLKRLLLM